MGAIPFDRIDILASRLAVPRDARSVRQRLLFLEKLLDSAVRLPGNQSVGLDAFIGLIPVIGDLLSASIGTYIVWEARNLGMSRWACTRMLGKVGLDAAIGAIPFVGNVMDFFYRSNTQNVRTVLAWLEQQHPGSTTINGVKL